MNNYTGIGTFGDYPWNLYIPNTTYINGSGNLSASQSITVSSNSSNSTDPYFDPENVASPALDWLLWDAPIYNNNIKNCQIIDTTFGKRIECSSSLSTRNVENPDGNPVTGLKAGGGTPMADSVGDMYGYFQNSLNADSAETCGRKNFAIIITDGEANAGCNENALTIPNSPLAIPSCSTPDNINNPNGVPSAYTPYEVYDLYNLSLSKSKYPIELFMIGFGYSNAVGSGTYIQGMANAGAGINPEANPDGITKISATVQNSAGTLLEIPTTLFGTKNSVLVGDTISDNGWQSSDCEVNNNYSDSYTKDCATITAVYPNSNEILLSNSLAKTPSDLTLTLSGTVYLAYNLTDLESSLTTIFNQIEKQTASFTSPVANETSTGQYVYYTDFKSLNQPLWGEGNIFLFKLNSTCPSGFTLNSSGNECVEPAPVPATCPSGSTLNSLGTECIAPPYTLSGPYGSAVGANGQILTGDSYWDNGNGAGGLLQSNSGSSRYVLSSYLNPSSGSQDTETINSSNTAVSSSSGNSVLQTLLGVTAANTSTICPSVTTANPATSAEVTACTADILNFVLDPDSSTDKWKLGAIFHSSPVIVGPPAFPYSSSSYQLFKQEYTTTNPRNVVLYVGANDGMLHAFNAGSWDSSTNSYTYGTGAEVFGYIPPNLLPKITSWYDSSIGVGTKLNFPEFVDSTPVASDVFFSNIFNEYVNNGTSTGETTPNSIDGSNYPLNQSSLQNSWHTVLVGGERNGGNYYYALGITNPSSSSYPDPLWNITDSSMGNTWSKPYVSYVCLPNPYYKNGNSITANVCGNNPETPDSSLAPEFIKTYAAFIGGGYSSTNSLGNALYALYVEPNPVNTGTSAAPNYTDEQILWEFPSAKDLNSNMKYSIPSAVTPVLSQNFRIEGFYAGDLGGQMWSVNIPDGSAPYKPSGASNWDACRIFASEYGNTATYPASEYPPLNIFFSPATSTDTSGNFWVYFGTGNREDLNEVITSRNNEFIAINTTAIGGPLTCPSGGPINESDLVNQTGVSGSTENLTDVQSADGWYITLRGILLPDGKYSGGEKVTSVPIVYDDIIYFTTFTPSSATNACGYGTSKLYALNYLNGGGTILVSSSGITINAAASTLSGAVQSTTIGSGVASAPVITNNGYLDITTSTGNVFTQQIPSLPSKVTPTSWFQEP